MELGQQGNTKHHWFAAGHHTAGMQLTLPSNERLTVALPIAQKHCGGVVKDIVRRQSNHACSSLLLHIPSHLCTGRQERQCPCDLQLPRRNSVLSLMLQQLPTCASI